jgi:hypothetical protein
LAKGNIIIHNPLNQDKLLKGKVRQRSETIRIILAKRCLNSLSFAVNTMFPFLVVGDVGCAFDNEWNIILILFLITAFNVVVVS